MTTPHDSMVAESGCLLISDVSGYTSYLQATELEHAQDVLADLTETLVGHLRPALRVSKLEGDAAFAYALEAEIEASMLLDTIDETYFAFRSRLRDIRQATTCQCNACLLIPNLDLKFAAHHGRFVRSEVAGGEELTGSDVILTHRLLKNGVRDRLGLRGYALLTDRCVTVLGIDPNALGMLQHRERYQDIGEVLGYVEDLEARWKYEQERRRIFILPAQAQFELVTVPGPSSGRVGTLHLSSQAPTLADRVRADRPDQPRRPARARNHQPLRPRSGRYRRRDPRLASVPLLHAFHNGSHDGTLDHDLRVPPSR